MDAPTCGSVLALPALFTPQLGSSLAHEWHHDSARDGVLQMLPRRQLGDLVEAPAPDDGEAVLDLCLRGQRSSTPPPPPPLSPSPSTFPAILCAHNAKACSSSRPTRPFKAYPSDPLSMAATESLLGRGSSEAYLEFRRRMLEQLQATGACGKAGRSPGQQQQHQHQQPSSSDLALGCEDGGRGPAYWEKRRKNNEAARRSRDARRAKEDELAIRAAFLEQENLKLKYEVTALRTEASKLRHLLFSSSR